MYVLAPRGAFLFFSIYLQHILDIDTIVRMYAGDEYAELKKWQDDDDVLHTSIQTLCDVRRHVEAVFGA
jgi:hypothetical protein